MSRYRLTHRAKLDLREIWAYVAADNPAAADGLIDRFYDKFRLLMTQPLLGELRADLGANLRCLAAGTYLLLYRPSKDGVEIVRVVHGARDLPTLKY